MILRSLLDRRASDAGQGWLRSLILGDGTKSLSGEVVTESKAMALSAYFCAIRSISEDVAKLPISVYKRLDPRGKERATRHPTYRILHSEPNPEMTAIVFRETLTAHALGYHGGFAEISRGGDGRPRELWPLDPTRVRIARDTAGEMVYAVRNDHGEEVVLRSREMFHVHGLGFDGRTGYVLAQIARESLGAALATQRFRGAYYGQGATMSGVLEVPEVLSEPAFQRLRESFQERHGGSANAHKPVILEEGTKFSATSNDPGKAQMVETSLFNVEDVSRWFRIPLSKLNHLLKAANFNSLEQLNTAYVVDCLMGWLVRWEQEANRKLFLPNEALFAEHVVNGLLRGDMAARSAYYREQWNIGAMSQNDIRELENQNPIDGGDAYFVPMNMQPLDRALAEPEPEPVPKPAPPAPAPAPAPPDDEPPPAEDDSARTALVIDGLADAHMPLLAGVYRSILHAEADKAGRAAKRRALPAWAETFYPTHGEHVRGALIPVIDAFTASVWMACGCGQMSATVLQRIGTFTGEAAARHVELSQSELASVGERAIADWTSERAAGAAENEMTLLAELMKGLVL